jgi:dUTP pyrophosphatase
MKTLFDTETGINNGYILIPKTLKQMDALTETIKALDEMSALTKSTKAKPTLVSTGMKCRLDKGTYLELAIRSSSPLKYWLILANGVGIIDEDYYNNPDNEGEIFFQIINLSPFPIKIQKGEIIGQGIIKPYLLAEGDAAAGQRTGGLGSTTK